MEKEYIRHKRILCSIKEFSSSDIQNKWDLAYFRAFASKPSQIGTRDK